MDWSLRKYEGKFHMDSSVIPNKSGEIFWNVLLILPYQMLQEKKKTSFEQYEIFRN